MTTFSTLKSDIEVWYPHSDYTDTLKNSFVRICEAQIRRKVRVRPMEVTDETFAVSSRSTALPSGFIAMRSVSVDAANKRNLTYLPPARMRSAPVWDLDSGSTPTTYTIEGENLIIAPVPSASTNLHLVYFKAFDALTNPSDTNWLLTNAYDIYLYGSLRAASEWALDSQKEAEYAAKFSAYIEEVNREHRWSRVSGDRLIRTGGPSP